MIFYTLMFRKKTLKAEIINFTFAFPFPIGYVCPAVHVVQLRRRQLEPMVPRRRTPGFKFTNPSFKIDFSKKLTGYKNLLRSEKNPMPKFNMKSCFIDIYEWLFLKASIFCPLFFFLTKINLVHLKRVLLFRNWSKFRR